jgi:hypothetical protein
VTRVLVSPLRLAFLAATLLAGCLTPPGYEGGEAGAPCATVTECQQGLVCKDGTCQNASTPCEANTTRCEGLAVLRCNKDGTEYEVAETCGRGCLNGACTKDICTPNKYKCEGDQIVVCSDDGQRLLPVEICPIGCSEANETRGPECNAAICRAGATRCGSDSVLETCDSRGLEWVPTDCTDGGANAACVSNGAGGTEASAFCQQRSCAPGTIRCAGNSVVQCNADGSGESSLLSCDFGCNADGTCKAPLCVPNSYRCSEDGLFVEICNSLGSGFARQRCDLSGAGRCVATPGSAGAAARCVSTTCSASEKRCDGDKLLACDALGETSSVVETCPFGCEAGACKPAACAITARRCGGDNNANLERCAPDRRGFVFDQFCAAGCTLDATASGGARCEAQLCSPFLSRCTPDSSAVETCSASGTGYTGAVPCAAGSSCRNGTCVAEASQCLPGARRCNAGDLETCNNVSGVDTFVKFGGCLGQCLGTACDAAGECGSITLSVAHVGLDEELPADGRSTFLVFSKPLTGPNGGTVPDGTLVTVSVDANAAGGTPARIDSGDADPNAPGLQVPVLNGRIDFVVRAPQLASAGAEVVVRAQIGSRTACSGARGLHFVPTPTGPSANTIFHAEDFSTLRNRDPSSALSDWNTKTGTLQVSKFDAGDGRDGVLEVPVTFTSAAPYDLTTRVRAGKPFADGYQTFLREISPSGNRISLEGTLTPFSQPGTRILLVNVRGEVGRASSVGAWELVESAGTADGELVLARPVTRIFGVGGNSVTALAGQVVRAIRVPQFSRVIVAGVLTAAGFDANGAGGILAFFASSTTTGPTGNVVTGTITMDAKGYRGAPIGSAGFSNITGGTGVAGCSGNNCGNAVAQSCAGTLGSQTTCNYPTGMAGSVSASCTGNCTTVGSSPLARTAAPSPVEPRSGEGPEGRWGATTYMKGYGTSGGGTCCGSGNVAMPAPSANPASVGTPNTLAYVFSGAGGSYGSVGTSTCAGEAGEGSADVYGDSLLFKMFMGSGSGSVSMSQSATCHVTRTCLRNATGGCCSQPTTNFTPERWVAPCAGTFSNCGATPAPAVAPIIAVNDCNNQPTYSYCDARAEIYTASQAGVAGGGMIWITAANLEMGNANARILANGATNTNGTWGLSGYGSAGGSIYLRAARLTLGSSGTGKILARGGNGGGDGRIRLDIGTAVESSFNAAWTSPDATIVPITSDQVSSTIVVDISNDPDFSKLFISAGVFVLPALVDAPTNVDGDVEAETSYIASDLQVRVTADNAASTPGLPTDGTVVFSPSTTPPLAGQKVRWYVRPATNAVRGGTRGLALRLTRQP